MTRIALVTLAVLASGVSLSAQSTGRHVSINAPTQLLEVKGVGRYAFRRFGSGPGLPLLLLQHFTGTLDNWDPALTDALAAEREVILFDNAGVGRSSGEVPTTIAEMTRHVVAFLDGLGVRQCDVLGFSLGGMIAQQMVVDHPTLVRRLILVGTAPRGGEDIMTLQTPRIAKALQDPSNKGYSVLQTIFFPTAPPRRLPAPRSSNDLASGGRTWMEYPGPRLPARRWPHSESGTNLPVSALPISEPSGTRRSS